MKLIRTIVLAALPLAFSAQAATSLPALLAEAFAAHPALRMQRGLGDAAQAGVESARYQFYPTPSVAVEHASTGKRDVSYAGDDRIVVLRLQQPLWTGGRLSGNLDKAEAGALVALADYEATRQQLGVRLIQAWGEGLAAQAKLRALEQSERTHAQLLEQVKRRTLEGFSAQADIELARARLDATSAELSNARVQRDSALARISNLVGRTLPEDILPELGEDSAVDKEIVGLKLGTLLDMAWQESPQRVKSEAQLRQAEAEIDIASAALMPEVYVRAERQHGNFSVAGQPPQNRAFIGMNTAFGAGLSAKSAVDAARARQRAAQDEMQTQRLAVNEQVQLDYALVESAGQRRASLQRSLASSASVMASWERQFLAGRKQWQDLMNAAREQAVAETQLADAMGAELVARWRLFLLTRGADGILGNAGMKAVQ